MDAKVNNQTNSKTKQHNTERKDRAPTPTQLPKQEFISVMEKRQNYPCLILWQTLELFPMTPLDPNLMLLGNVPVYLADNPRQ